MNQRMSKDFKPKLSGISKAAKDGHGYDFIKSRVSSKYKRKLLNTLLKLYYSKLPPLEENEVQPATPILEKTNDYYLKCIDGKYVIGVNDINVNVDVTSKEVKINVIDNLNIDVSLCPRDLNQDIENEIAAIDALTNARCKRARLSEMYETMCIKRNLPPQVKYPKGNVEQYKTLIRQFSNDEWCFKCE